MMVAPEGWCVSHRAAAWPVGGSGYNVAVAEPHDEFPNNYVGDFVHDERGWVVVPPTCGAPITPVCESAHGKAWYNPAEK
jgi:hypothetical protein